MNFEIKNLPKYKFGHIEYIKTYHHQNLQFKTEVLSFKSSHILSELGIIEFKN